MKLWKTYKNFLSKFFIYKNFRFFYKQDIGSFFNDESSYGILTGYVISGVVSQEILNIITETDKINSNLYFYDSFKQNSDCIDFNVLNKELNKNMDISSSHKNYSENILLD